MKIKVINDNERISRYFALIGIMVIASIILTGMIFNSHPLVIQDNKYFLQFNNQCWESSAHPGSVYCSPIKTGDGTWADMNTNSSESFLK